MEDFFNGDKGITTIKKDLEHLTLLFFSQRKFLNDCMQCFIIYITLLDPLFFHIFGTNLLANVENHSGMQ